MSNKLLERKTYWDMLPDFSPSSHPDSPQYYLILPDDTVTLGANPPLAGKHLFLILSLLSSYACLLDGVLFNRIN